MKVKFTQLAANDTNQLILTSTGQLFGCGYINGDEQWHMDGIYRTFPPSLSLPLQADEQITQLAVIMEHTFVLTSTGQLFGYSSNIHDQMGFIGKPFTFKPLSLPLQAGEKITQLAVSNLYTLVLTSTDRLLCCEVYAPDVYAPLDSGNTPRPRFTFKPLSLPLQAGEKIIQLTVSHRYTLVLTSIGRLLGCNNHQFDVFCLGTPPFTFMPLPLPRLLLRNEQIIQVIGGRHFCFALTSTGRLLGCHLSPSKDDSIANAMIVGQFAHPAMRLPVIEEAGVLREEPENQQNCLALLPEELLTIIFKHAPPSSYYGLMQVCKRFRRHLSDQHKQLALTLAPCVAEPKIYLADVMHNAYRIYECLPPAEQAAFKAAFLRCIPQQISTTTALTRFLSLDALLIRCPVCVNLYNRDGKTHAQMVLHPCEHSICITCLPKVFAGVKICPKCRIAFDSAEKKDNSGCGLM